MRLSGTARHPTLRLSRGPASVRGEPKGGVRGGAWLPSVCWDGFCGNRAYSPWAADFRKGCFSTHPPTSLPLPQSQISICPHGLHSKSSALHTVANLPNYSKKAGGKKSTSPSSPKSPFPQHGARVNTAPSKWGYSAIKIKLPSPKFKKFPAVFV